MSPLRQLSGIPGHKLAFSPVCLYPPLGGSFCSLRSPLRSSSTCTWLRQTSVEQAILIAPPHTTLPAPLIPRHHPSVRLNSRRKSSFPEAITLSTLRSGLKCDLWAQTGIGLACVCAAAKSNTEQCEVLVSSVWSCGRKAPCFLYLPL